MKFPEEKRFNTPEGNHVFSMVSAAFQFCFWILEDNEIKRPVLDGQKVDSTWMNNITEQALRSKNTYHFLKNKLQEAGDAGLQLIPERLKILHEVSRTNLYQYGLLWNSEELSKDFMLRMKCFQEDPFHKKMNFALLYSSRLNGTNFQAEVPIDYWIPTVLEHKGLIQYPEKIKKKVQNKKILSKEEAHQIRTLAYEKVKELPGTPQEIDQDLFMEKYTLQEKGVPHFLEKTTWY